MVAINKQDLINYLKKSPENLNFNIFGTMLEDFRNTYETDEQIVNKIKGIITNIIDSGESISPEDDTITELVDLITELLPEKMIIKPVGTLEITENGEYDVMNKAGVNVSIPLPSGTVSITQNGTTNVNDYEYANVNVSVARVVNPALILWDWEGTKLAEYSVEDALILTELPAPSTFSPYEGVDHDLLIFQEWNWSLANIKSWIQAHEGKPLDVGAIYTTTDGQDHNYWGNPRLDTATTITMQKRGTASIGSSAFDSCYVLTQINIPDGVTSIGNYAFRGCRSLTQINIPDGVTSIGSNAFRGCSSLTRINIPDSVTSIGDYAFDSCYALTQINIPDGVTSIGSNAFSGCRSLTQINIPDGVTNIKSNAFQSCSSLAKVNIPDSVTSIGDYAFQSCSSLAKVNIPDSVTSIGNNVFMSCESLTQINIPDGITSIDNYTFQGCYSLCDILLELKPTLAKTNAFANLPSIYRIYVPRANLSWFETATNWSTIYTQEHIVAIEDYIEYLESIGFNVDKYKE